MSETLILSCYLLSGLPIGWLLARSVFRTPLTPEQAKQSIISFSAGVVGFLFWAGMFMSTDVVGIGFVGFILEVYLPVLIVLLNRAAAVKPPADQIDDPIPRG